jgi:hypothetical protein
VALADLDGYTLDEATRLLKVHKGTAQHKRLRALARLHNRFVRQLTPIVMIAVWVAVE